MKRIAKASGIVEATLWHDMLTAAGIEASVQRMYLQGSVGEVPPHEAALEIWVAHEEQVERARELIDDLRHAPQRRWFCSNCKEQIEGGFEQCWKCGALMPG
jgi:Putative prokaryotic signal transducing protein